MPRTCGAPSRSPLLQVGQTSPPCRPCRLQMVWSQTAGPAGFLAPPASQPARGGAFKDGHIAGLLRVINYLTPEISGMKEPLLSHAVHTRSIRPNSRRCQFIKSLPGGTAYRRDSSGRCLP